MFRKVFFLGLVLSLLATFALTTGASTDNAPAASSAWSSPVPTASFDTFEVFLAKTSDRPATANSRDVCVATNEEFQACMAACIAGGTGLRVCVSQCLFVPCD